MIRLFQHIGSQLGLEVNGVFILITAVKEDPDMLGPGVQIELQNMDSEAKPRLSAEWKKSEDSIIIKAEATKR